jgi:hypothetical protein
MSVDPYDPRRCQASTRTGQCHYKALDGVNFCQQHNGKTFLKAKEKEELQGYQLGRWQEQVKQFHDDPGIKSLRAEIGVTRLTLQALLTKCQDNDELLMAHDKILQLVNQLTKTVERCHVIEEKAGNLLDKNAVVNLAQVIIAAIKNHIQDEDLLDVIVQDIMACTSSQLSLPT